MDAMAGKPKERRFEIADLIKTAISNRPPNKPPIKTRRSLDDYLAAE
jgi:hypothetical protein